MSAPVTLDRPALEGSVAVRDGRRLSFAEYGAPRGRAVVWMHGTPGARRQVPVKARRLALEQGVRIIGVDQFASKRELAETMGATDFVDASTQDPVEAIMELTQGEGVNYAFEAVGKDTGAKG